MSAPGCDPCRGPGGGSSSAQGGSTSLTLSFPKTDWHSVHRDRAPVHAPTLQMRALRLRGVEEFASCHSSSCGFVGDFKNNMVSYIHPKFRAVTTVMCMIEPVAFSRLASCYLGADHVLACASPAQPLPSPLCSCPAPLSVLCPLTLPSLGRVPPPTSRILSRVPLPVPSAQGLRGCGCCPCSAGDTGGQAFSSPTLATRIFSDVVKGQSRSGLKMFVP